MTFDEFEKMLGEQSRQIKQSEPMLGDKLAAEGLRFVDDNFRRQSWEGTPWKATQRGGTILVLSGHLKNSFNSDEKPGEVRIYSNVPYGAVHNEGFEGTVQVKAHKRSQYKKAGRGKKKKSSSGMVKAHSRRMKIEQRQFAPTAPSPSPTLDKQVRDIIENHFKAILNPEP